MKFILMCMLTLCVTMACADNEKVIELNRLPQAAQKFVGQHFPDGKVAFVKMETEIMSKSYEVTFVDGCHVDFDGKGNWTEVDCNRLAVPTAIIPTRIVDYVKANYPDAVVTKIERGRRDYEVKLSNRIELKFDTKFKLIDIDM